ncbi:MAG: fibrillarin-like rRNA/tRNA 2'-O-methyltransferase [Euryarchaeota archaeon]|nr:fibrillarin-like rRNA/tRNA 2'-O-methyltransferase [Euryarchaeota archaeon]
MYVKPHKIPSVFIIGKHLATRGEAVYGEKTFGEYRVWDPKRSKLAALLKKYENLPLDTQQIVLYLGAASGTTASHLADIVSLIYAVEFAPRVARNLVRMAEQRSNVIPLIADASRPDYGHIVELVDLLYQDIAQKNQADIAIVNAEMFLRSHGYACIFIKARSIDVTAKPKAVYQSQVKKLKEIFDVMHVFDLSPYYKDHAAVITRLI